MFYAYKKYKEYRARKAAEADAATPAQQQGPQAGAQPPNQAGQRAWGTEPTGNGAKDTVKTQQMAQQAPPASTLTLSYLFTTSKGRSYFAMLLVGFAMALDYSSSMMSIQTLYYLVNGPQNLYGLTFGSYDLAALVFAPLFAFWAERTHKFWWSCMVGMAMNAGGNLLYAFTVKIGDWYIMLIGRLIAGAGSTILATGSLYITWTTLFDERRNALGMYRVTQSMARFVGPFIGYFFLNLPEPTDGSSNEVLIFNWYTMPGWFAFFTVIVLMALFAAMYREPTKENGHFVGVMGADSEAPVNEEEENANAPQDPAEQARREKEFHSFFYLHMLVVFLVTFSAFGYYSNLFALYAGTFHGVTQQSDMWRTFIAVGAGSAGGAMLYRRLPQRVAVLDERGLMALGVWLLLPAWLLVIDYHGESDVPSVALYYASNVVAGISVVIYSTAAETFLSKKISLAGQSIEKRAGRYLGVCFAAMSAGRFAGPLVTGAVTWLGTVDGDINVCAPPTSAMCCITATTYYIDACVLYRNVIWYSIMAGFQFFVSLLTMYTLWVYGRY